MIKKDKCQVCEEDVSEVYTGAISGHKSCISLNSLRNEIVNLKSDKKCLEKLNDELRMNFNTIKKDYLFLENKLDIIKRLLIIGD